MKKSEISYFVNTQASLSGRQGSSQYNFKKNQFDILIDKNASNPIGALGDELTHAYQFETGKIGYIEMVNGEVRTLGSDMEDEVDSKRGEIDATESVNKKEGINIQLSNTAKAFQKADTDPIPSGQTRSGMIENYFKKDPSAQQYLNQFDPRGKQMGVNIPGNANYTKQTLLKAVQAGQFKDFIYREKGGDGKIQTVKGSK